MLTLKPLADGDLLEWAANPTPPSFDKIQDFNGDDGDATMIRTTGPAPQTSLFRFEDLSVVYPQVPSRVLWVGVSASLRARLGGPSPDPGLVSGVLKSGGQFAVFPPLLINSSVYASRGGFAEGWWTDIDPATGAPWTPLAAASCQAGIRDVQNPALSYSSRCTSMRKLVDVDFDWRAAPVRGVY